MIVKIRLHSMYKKHSYYKKHTGNTFLKRIDPDFKIDYKYELEIYWLKL